MKEKLIHADGCVLAGLDHSAYTASVADHAGWAASRLQAPLTLLHAIERGITQVVTDLSGNLTLGGREELLSKLASLDEQQARFAQEHGRLLLEQSRDRVLNTHGVSAAIQQRHGTLVDVFEELESATRLFVLGKRGEHADFAKGHLGSNLERVVRSVHRPVLVAARTFKPPQRFLIAFDGSATTRRCVEMVCASPLLRGIAGLMVSVGEATPALQAHLDWANAQFATSGYSMETRVLSGTTETVIAQQVDDNAVDLLVMGAYGHSRIRNLIVGSTTTQVLRACQIPVLLLR